MTEGFVVMLPGVVAYVMAALLFFVSRTAKKFDSIFDEKPAIYWALGFFMVATTWLEASVITVTNYTPDNGLILLNNLTFTSAMYLWCYGVWWRNRMTFAWQWMLPLLAAECIGLSSFIFVVHDYAARSIVLHVTGAVLSLAMVLALLRYPVSRYGDRLLLMGFVLYGLFNGVLISSYLSDSPDSFFNNANASVDFYKTISPLIYLMLGVLFLGVMLLDVIEELSEKSRHDFLTGIYNRFGFEQAYLETLEKARRVQNRGMVLVVLDLDKFKLINDEFGHSVGDMALTWFSSLMQQSARKSDLLGRLGGDEFVMLMWDCERDQSLEFLRRFSLLCKISPVPEIQENIVISASYGICEVSSGSSLDELIASADKNLYVAKDNLS